MKDLMWYIPTNKLRAEKILFSILLLAMTLCLTACGCKHEWNDATCTAPKTCKLCQETEGEPPGHQWKNATCTEPKTCAVCKATEGGSLGHSFTEETTVDYVRAATIVTRTCGRCGDSSETAASLSALHDGAYFLMSPSEFDTRFENILITIVEEIRGDGVDFHSEYLSFLEESAAVRIYLAKRLNGDNDQIDTPGFLEARELTYSTNEVLPYAKKDTRASMNMLRGPVKMDDAYIVVFALVRALDPAADNKTAAEIYEELEATGNAEANGITYSMATAQYIKQLWALIENSAEKVGFEPEPWLLNMAPQSVLISASVYN